MSQRRAPRRYDHRLQELVRETGDLSIATDLGVPRSTAAGWLRNVPPNVVTLDVLDMGKVGLETEVLKLWRRVRILGAVVGLRLALLRVFGFPQEGSRLPKGEARTALLRAIHRARAVLSLRSVLRVLGI